jgi:hypothetical protein
MIGGFPLSWPHILPTIKPKSHPKLSQKISTKAASFDLLIPIIIIELRLLGLEYF